MQASGGRSVLTAPLRWLQLLLSVAGRRGPPPPPFWPHPRLSTFWSVLLSDFKTFGIPPKHHIAQEGTRRWPATHRSQRLAGPGHYPMDGKDFGLEIAGFGSKAGHILFLLRLAFRAQHTHEYEAHPHWPESIKRSASPCLGSLRIKPIEDVSKPLQRFARRNRRWSNSYFYLRVLYGGSMCTVISVL